MISSANSKELVGKSILWEDNSGVQKTFGGFLTVARVKDSQSVIPEYLFLVYRYMFKIGYFANLSAQTTNIANLSNKLLDSLVFPIAPLAEQKRIATQINQLFEQIDCAEKAYNELSGPLSERFRQLCLEKAIQGKLVPQLGTNSPRIAFSRIFCRKISKFIFELLAKVSKSRIQHLQLLLHPIQKLIHVEHFDFGFFFLQPAR